MDKLLELFKKRKELADEIAAITAKIKSAKTDEELAEIETKQKEVEAILSELQEVEKQIAEESARIETEQKTTESKDSKEVENNRQAEAETERATGTAQTTANEPEIKTNSAIKVEEICAEKKEITQMSLTTRDKINQLILRNKDTMQTFADDMKKYQQRNLLGTTFAVPAQIIDVVVDLMKEHDVLRAVDMEKVNGYARVTYFSEFPEAYWTDKAHTKADDKKIYTMDLDGYGLANYLAIDAYQEEDLGTYITIVVEALAESMSAKLEEAVFNGDGSNCPAGIKTYVAAKTKPDYFNEEKQGEFTPVNDTNVKSVEVFGVGADGYKTLAKELVKIKKHNDSKEISLAMTESTFKRLMLELASSDAGFNAALANSEKELPLMGKVLFTEQLKDDNIVAGYFDTYKLPVRDEVKLARSTEYEFADNKICYRATARADGRPMFGDAFMDITLTTKAKKAGN